MPNRKSKKTTVIVQKRSRPAKVRGGRVKHGNGIKQIISTIGSSMGGPVGGLIGRAAGAAVQHIMGQGDYQVEKNTLMSNSGPPSFSTNGDDVIVKHREFITDVVSSIALSQYVLPLNPANTTTFPWLSGIAKNFEEYELLGMIFEYKPTSGSAIASTNNALGTVILCSDYNVLNAVPTTKRACETLEFSTSCNPSESMIHPIECSKDRNVLFRGYTTSQNVTSVQGDARMYFLGNTFLTLVGMQANSITVGELWVSYQVRLSRPIFPSMSLISPNYGIYNQHTCICVNPNNTGIQPNINVVNGYFARSSYAFALTSPFSYGTPITYLGPSVVQNQLSLTLGTDSEVPRAQGGTYLVTTRFSAYSASPSTAPPTYTTPNVFLYPNLSNGLIDTSSGTLPTNITNQTAIPGWSAIVSGSANSYGAWMYNTFWTGSYWYTSWFYVAEFSYNPSAHPYGFTVQANCNRSTGGTDIDIEYADVRTTFINPVLGAYDSSLGVPSPILPPSLNGEKDKDAAYRTSFVPCAIPIQMFPADPVPGGPAEKQLQSTPVGYPASRSLASELPTYFK
jgi:hypothetical protein